MASPFMGGAVASGTQGLSPRLDSVRPIYGARVRASRRQAVAHRPASPPRNCIDADAGIPPRNGEGDRPKRWRDAADAGRSRRTIGDKARIPTLGSEGPPRRNNAHAHSLTGGVLRASRGRRSRSAAARVSPSGAKTAASVPVMKAWQPSSASTWKRAPRRVSSRWAAISSRRMTGVSPVSDATSRAWARTRPMRSAFCSPVEQLSAAICFGPWRTSRSERCGPKSVRPAAASRGRSAARSER